MSIEDKVEELLGSVVATRAVELVDVEYSGGTLRLTIDREGGVTTEQLAEVNRLVSSLLDQDDPVPGRYTLEVSSPGLERALRRPGHYERAVGEDVVVKMVPEVEPRRYKGRLTGFGDGAMTLEVVEVDGVDLAEARTERIELDLVASARTVFEWGPSPKPGGGGAKRAKQSATKKTSGKSSAKSKSGRSRGVR